MFRVHKKQHQALADKAFVDKLEADMAEDMLGRPASLEERARLPLREMIEHGISVARGYGLITQRDLAFFVLNMVTINPEFHLQPHIQAILRDRSLDPPERRDKMLMDVSDEEWDQAAKMTGSDAYWARVLPPVD
jgi:hypothetical protein